jgi:hypothetical protein
VKDKIGGVESRNTANENIGRMENIETAKIIIGAFSRNNNVENFSLEIIPIKILIIVMFRNLMTTVIMFRNLMNSSSHLKKTKCRIYGQQ